MAAPRDKFGRFKGKRISKASRGIRTVLLDHNYESGHTCEKNPCEDPNCPLFRNIKLGKYAERESWREGRRIVELGVLLESLQCCQFCKLGPVPLTHLNVVGELRKGLGGFLYVKCLNVDCGGVNLVPYGKTHRLKKTGMPCFAINTKLGTGMIDSIGGPVRVNNFLSTLNLKPVNSKSLKNMERRAGVFVEAVANTSTRKAATDAFNTEMEEIGEAESAEALKSMGQMIDDLGVCPLPDSLVASGKLLNVIPSSSLDLDISFESDDTIDDQQQNNASTPRQTLSTPISDDSPKTPCNPTHLEKRVLQTPRAPSRSEKFKKKVDKVKGKKVVKLSYPCKTRRGMSAAADTAWHKRGFDSLTSHTFFMSKAKYGRKVIKSVVRHRTCGTCNWWRRNRPRMPVRKHRCVCNHIGSAKLMECKSGVQGVKELSDEGTPIEIIEGDGDTTMLSHIKSDLNMTLKKRYDRNHIVKNIGKNLYSLKKISKSVIQHIQKCIKYAFAKNQGDKTGMEENLRAIIPHQFGDHSSCHSRFCGFKWKPEEKYVHRSLPYKASLKDDSLRSQLEKIFEPIVNNAEQLADLGSSQQCEHANREVTLRAPKSLHYGNSESLDFRVAATAAFINEGRNSRKYITQVHKEAGLSPGKYTTAYAEQMTRHRKRVQEKSSLPSTKRRRLMLKQERAVTQGANEALEGASYQSGIGLTVDADVEHLPEAVPQGNFKPVPAGENTTFIVFDLETTDLVRGGKYPHITQIAASVVGSVSEFSAYVYPKVPIASTAQQITGIIVNNSGTMTVHGQQVHAEDLYSSIDKFCKWLKKYPSVYLIAHNGRKFDFPVLMNAMMNIKREAEFLDCVTGCIDSLNVFKKAFTSQSYKQEDLARTILNTTYDAHNAMEDVKVLGKLISHTRFDATKMCIHSFPPSAVINQIKYNREKAKNVTSLHLLVGKGILKMSTAEKVAGSGLNLGHLKKIYEREGEDGLRNIFSCKNREGQPRVTNIKKTLEEIMPKLGQFFSSCDS